MMGGWDSSDDGGGWDFEERATAATIETLIQSDKELCALDAEKVEAGNGEAQGEDRLRYVPGDPFSMEAPDVEAWRKHFVYLAVEGRGLGLGDSNEALPGCVSPVTGNDTSSDTSRNPEQQDLGICIVGKKARLSSRPAGFEEDEEVIAADGVLEEYLAYDARGPGDGDMEGSGRQAVEEEVLDELVSLIWQRLVPDVAAAGRAVKRRQGQGLMKHEVGKCMVGRKL